MSNQVVTKTNPHIINKGYGDAGASTIKRALKGFKAQSGSPQEDIDYNNYTLRQRARMSYMGAPIATSAVKTSRTNVIGLGLKLNPKIDRIVLGISAEDAEAWERNVKSEFAIWASDKNACDATGINDFYSMQQLAFSSWLINGDVMALRKESNVTKELPYGLRIHIIEADRVATPGKLIGFNLSYTEGVNTDNKNKIHDGVEVDKNGKIVAYHIRNTYPFQTTVEPTDWIRVEAYGAKTGLPNVIHVMSSERPEQYRGVSYLAQIIEPLIQIKRYTDSEITAALVESFFTAFITSTAPKGEDGIPLNETGEEGEEKVTYDPNEYEMGPGQVNVMNKGEGVEFADPKRPGSNFDGFIKSICTQMGAALEIPVDLLLKEFNSSYSASRAALLEAWKSFRMYREWFASDFCKPIYKIWLSEAIARGRIKAPGFFTDPRVKAAWLGCEWIGPSQGQLDPVKEITAEIMAVEQGYSTNEDSTIKLNGGDWNANMNKLERENERKTQVLRASNTDIASGSEKNTNMTDFIRKTVRDCIKESIKEEVQEFEQTKI
ncbi:phage portal protein [Lachnotalea glycerini]|uniref:Phage portal protein n=1 Tax=Lachnotalea glycerini TaxID=1763509 RepID=A0A371J7K0_9FIRM|nr:phage portal protein [Lachnotalea glycerini]RDY28647.1 phage portal protein [Lachnotalea glycerini]